MATAKKSTSKKAPVKKSTASKATTARKAPVKRVIAKKKNASKLQSFRVSKNTVPFTTFKVTRQTFYWVILISFIIFMQLWIIQLQLEVADLIQTYETELQTELY